MIRTPRRSVDTDPERLTTPELLAAHERLFGRLEPQAKRRMQATADSGRETWNGMAGRIAAAA